VKIRRQMAGPIVLFFALQTVAHAQDPATQKPAPTSKPASATASNPSRSLVPIRLQFVVSKYQGEKKISSLPYSMSLNANGPAVRLRMGGQVPITTVQSSEGKASRSFSYRDVGLSIDGDVMSENDIGQFRLDVTIEDSSISSVNQSQAPPAVLEAPVFRHFRTTNSVLLRDSQTVQLTTAADPTSGDVMRVDVTLTVVK
jgi:hypothetical protein